MFSTTKSKKTAVIRTIATNLGVIVSIAATAAAARIIAPKIKEYYFNKSQLTMVIDGLSDNEVYDAAMVYLGSKIKKLRSENAISVAIKPNQEIRDSFCDAEFNWIWVCHHNINLHFELRFDMKHKDLALNSYLPFVIQEAKNKKERVKTLKIFTVDDESLWKSRNFDHPETLATLPMDAQLKEKVINDLDLFLGSREKYRKNGRAWRRGYLIYGPPGTGKSSLVAAMANFLNFNVYHLEFGNLKSKWELKNLLMSTESRSIVVVEDIDSTVLWPKGGSQSQKADKITLLGFLKLIDGLWLSCGDERIIIFTTAIKLNFGPTLICPGRIDFEIDMSYCTQSCFRLLAYNHLGLSHHELFREIEELIPAAEVTPVEVAEHLFKGKDANVSVPELITYLQLMKFLKEAKAAPEKLMGPPHFLLGKIGKREEVSNPPNNAAAQGPAKMESQRIHKENESILKRQSVEEEVGKNDEEVRHPPNTGRDSEPSTNQAYNTGFKGRGKHYKPGFKGRDKHYKPGFRR